MEISSREAQIGGALIAWREAPALDPARAPVLYVHGVPDSAQAWDLLLSQTGGYAIDLPGFGRSAKPSGGSYSIEALSRAVEAFLAHVGAERVRLVLHDWGTVALAFAQRAPERVERLVLADVVPFLPGYRWHRTARGWRTPVVGELMMGFSTRFAFKRAMRRPDAAVDQVMSHFDHGTQRAILRLYRASGPGVLAEAGRDLGRITAPALILWGERDPYISTEFAHRLAAALGTPDPEVDIVAGAGHWAAMDDPEVAARIVRFLAA